MRCNNVLGIIFASRQDETLSNLTATRTLASVPFGGKYRLIDFPVSNMANSGIDKIGVVIKNNYHSLMDHMGSGKAWGLSRRRGGLVLLPPFINNSSIYGNRVETLDALKTFLNESTEDYVLISDCGEIYNIDYKEMLSQHVATNSDITIAYKRGFLPSSTIHSMIFTINDEHRINEILLDINKSELCNYALHSILIGKDLLMELIADCVSRNKLNFDRDILQANVDKLKIYGYCFNGFNMIINDIKDYFAANMALMAPSVRNELFNPSRPIYTKVRDDMPCKYGLNSSVKNSLVAQGCVIEGEVENCVIFKGVEIGTGTKLSNCVIMQDTKIGNNSKLSYVVCDKDCIINNDRVINGFLTYPVCVIKESVV